MCIFFEKSDLWGSRYSIFRFLGGVWDSPFPENSAFRDFFELDVSKILGGRNFFLSKFSFLTHELKKKFIQKKNPTDQNFRNPDFPDFQIFMKNPRFSTKFGSRWRFFVISRKSGFWIFWWVENFFRKNFFVVLIFTTKNFFQKKFSTPPKYSKTRFSSKIWKSQNSNWGEQKGAKSLILPHFGHENAVSRQVLVPQGKKNTHIPLVLPREVV